MCQPCAIGSQGLVSGIDIGELFLSGVLFKSVLEAIGMALGREREKLRLKHFRLDPGLSGQFQAREVIHHSAQALKLSPQEQVVAAFGLVTLNPPPCNASTKSSSEPVT